MNTRIQEAQTEAEKQHIGTNTFEPETTNLEDQTDEVQHNRNKLIQYCNNHEMILTNTKFAKTKHKLATYRSIGTTIGDEMKKTPTHEHIDYIITTQRWRHTLKHVESDTTANIDSDHYPVNAKSKNKT